MKLIGAGFGRTGTTSLKVALEALGFGPCYHMLEVIRRPSHVKRWQAAADGAPVDWGALFTGYEAVLDYPAAGFYKDLIAAYPEARVILTVRDPTHWYESTFETIYQGAALPDWLMRLIPPLRGFTGMVKTTVWDRLFAGRFAERDHAIAVFQEHAEEVKRVVSADKLLVYNVREGWEPLCGFLGVPIPDRPFPHINERKTIRRLFLLTRVLAALLALSAIAVMAWLVWGLI